ncbi:MAG TPA: hypothetical protein DDW17_04380 [Deltaproteobacteria bacterium]|nr:hypothetical protein [Deltaproteobacteria bacterium]
MYKRDTIDANKPHTIRCDNDEKKSIELREQVNRMYFAYRISKNTIAQDKGVSKKFVVQWTQSPNQDFSADMRGWTKGVRRKWGPSIIRYIHGHNVLNEKLVLPAILSWQNGVLANNDYPCILRRISNLEMIEQVVFLINENSKKH